MGADLTAYRSKRDFRRTPEPAGDTESAGQQPLFVVQEHDATAHHYEFRLEVEGVLKSWAVPKGPSYDPAVKRLAIQTEDHPMSYARFEGVIPEGEYGGGPVIVWDIGSYTNLSHDGRRMVPMVRALAKGHASFWLHGKKLVGGYHLVRTAGAGRPQWLLVKRADAAADAQKDPVRDAPESALSGRRLGELSPG